MNSLANLNAVVDEHGEASAWPSDDHGWDPPVATICSAAALSDSRLHLHPSGAPRQDWDWSDSQIILASQYNTAEEQDIDCKHGIMHHADSLGAGGGAGRLRQYNSILTATSVTPSLASMATQSSWPELLNAVPIRQTLGLESSSGSCYSPSFYGGGVAGLGGAGGGAAGGGGSALNSYYVQPSNLLGLGATDIEQRRLHDILKRGIYTASAGAGHTPDLISARIGLNLGGRTYFSAEDSTTLSGFHASKRFRPHSPASMHVPLCQAEGCKADLSIAKHYHRRHKVCEYHSKASTVIINGNTQRFCQQCSRFHALGEFDEGKRSCRKRLADHNRRRRKPQPPPAAATATNSAEAPKTSSTDNLALIPANKQEHDTKTATTQNTGVDPGQQANGQQLAEMESGASNKPVSSTEQTPSLISTMSLTPSILQLTLQNGNADNSHGNLVGSEDGDKGKGDSAAFHTSSQAPFLLNGGGPSLSLSSIAGAGAGTHVAPGGDTGKITNQQHVHSSTPTMSYTEVELSVPWLRAHHVGSSTSVMQESLGRSPGSHHEEEAGSVIFGGSARVRQANNTGQYLNEHGRLLAEQMQSLHSQAASRSASTSALRDHHAIKTENWILDNAVANDEEGQTVLSLLETASKKDHHHHHHQHHHPSSLGYTHHQDTHHQNSLHGPAPHHHHHHHREQIYLQDNARHHPLGFLQAHGAEPGAMNSSSSADINQEASEAALSLQCMQVLRPLNESLYPTADFMKDDFV